MTTGPTESSLELESKVRDAFHCFQSINQNLAVKDERGLSAPSPFLQSMRHLQFLKEYFEVHSNGDDSKHVDLSRYSGVIATLFQLPSDLQITVLGEVTQFFFHKGELQPPPFQERAS